MYNYVYILKKRNEEDTLLASNKKIPTVDLLMLMFEHQAEFLETYKTNKSFDEDQWELISILGGSEGLGCFSL